jgi:hypothetical protein
MKPTHAAPAGSLTDEAPPLTTPREVQTADFRDLFEGASPRIRKVTVTLLELLTGKMIHAREGSRSGDPLTDAHREEALSLVLSELERLRADGFPCEDIESVLSEITKGGKRA